ncbi:MAG: serine acetyltransferase [Desulfovibrionaceae bacterium]|nr:serine acetyltransferase [Desulfovibrionaceae bacterium]MBF0515291.1 serine acetyltransferase [Desulfovibrionaceae bacterium]
MTAVTQFSRECPPAPTPEEATAILDAAVASLCEPASYKSVYYRRASGAPMPSVAVMAEIMERLRAVLFPGYFGDSDVSPKAIAYHTGSHLDVVFRLLAEQVRRGYCFSCDKPEMECQGCDALALDLTLKFLSRLPRVRELLASDVQAAYDGDPAAKNQGETIFCYPSILALTHHRLAHELYQLGVDIIPRIISEMAHSKTGIDIHPGAQIGKRFFIDHGTGTVIGETCVIGDNVRLYQGVTLGAKSFPKDASGNPVKGLPRHPIVENDVIVYSGATILGRITIGAGSHIGGNVWVTENVPPGSNLVQSVVRQVMVAGGAGI